MDTNEIVATYGAARGTSQTRRSAPRSSSRRGPTTASTRIRRGSPRAAPRSIADIGGFHQMFPGHTINLTSGVDSNGTHLRFAWNMRNGDEVAMEGVDFVELAADGRIQRIAGFFGPLPPLDD